MKLGISVICAVFLFFHADGLAEYEYSLDNNHIALKIEMDQRELQHFRADIGCSQDGLIDLCSTKYILSHSRFAINGKPVVFEFENSSNYNGHIILNLRSVNEFSNIKKIQVKNSCFYELNSEFKNRIRIDIDNFQKSYLLTKGKEEINI